MKKLVYITIDNESTSQEVCNALIMLLDNLTLDSIGKLNVTAITVTNHRNNDDKAKWSKK